MIGGDTRSQMTSIARAGQQSKRRWIVKGSSKCRIRSMVVFFAPLVLLGGLLTLPYVSNYEESTLATEIGANTTRWSWGSLLIAAGIGMMVLVVFAARTYLRDHGEDFWSFLAVPAVTLGAAMLLYRFGFEGMTRAGLATPGQTGRTFVQATPEIAETLSTWRLWIGVSGAGLMGLGWLTMVVSMARSMRFGSAHVTLVTLGVLAGIAAIFIPAHWALYLLGGGAILTSWPIGERMWSDTSEPQPVLELIGRDDRQHAATG